MPSAEVGKIIYDINPRSLTAKAPEKSMVGRCISFPGSPIFKDELLVSGRVLYKLLASFLFFRTSLKIIAWKMKFPFKMVPFWCTC